MNTHQTITDMNPMLEQQLGIRAVDYLGKPYSRLLQQFPNQHSITNTHQEIIHNNRHYEPLQSAVFNYIGWHTGYIVVFHDVTHRNQSEQTLGSQLQQLEVLREVYDEISMLHIHDVILFALDATVRLSGGEAGYIALVDNHQELQVAQIVGGFDVDKLKQMLANKQGLTGLAWQTRAPIMRHDIRSDPDYINLIPNLRAMIVIPLITTQGNLVGLLTIGTPYPQRFTEEVFQLLLLLSNRIAAAIENAQLYQQLTEQFQQLQASHDQVARLEQFKTEMIRIASHDLRNPLGSVNLNLDLLERLNADASPKLTAVIQRIRDANQRMTAMVENILSLDRIETMFEAENPPHVSVNLGQILKPMLGDYQYRAAKNNIAFHSPALNDNYPVYGSVDRLQDVMDNLIDNALKFTPPDGDITVSLTIEGDSVVFRVIDSGYGIADEHHNEIFKPFYRVKTAQTQNIVGSGLGLYLVRRIIDLHGGTLDLQSAEQHGSTFTVRLPLAISEKYPSA